MRRWRAHSTRLQDQDNSCSRSRCRRPGRRRQRRCTLQALWVPHKCHRPNSRRLQGSRPWCCTWCRDPRTCRPPVRNRWRANSSNLRWLECSTRRPHCNRSRCTRCPRLATSRLCSGSRRPPGCCTLLRRSRRRAPGGIRRWCRARCRLQKDRLGPHNRLRFPNRTCHWEGSTRQGFGCKTSWSRWPA